MSELTDALAADLQTLDINQIDVAVALRIEVVALWIDDRWPGTGEAG